MEIVCPHCSHKQNTNSKLKKITCSSCQKKFDRVPTEKKSIPQIEKNLNPIPDKEKKEATPKVKLY